MKTKLTKQMEQALVADALHKLLKNNGDIPF